jgi:hypothetical protein
MREINKGIKTGYYINGLGSLTSHRNIHPIPLKKVPIFEGVEGGNAALMIAWGNCEFQHEDQGGRTPNIEISYGKPHNFLFIEERPRGIAVGYVDLAKLPSGGVHIYSDKFGGCEWHILKHNGHDTVAFLHVYKGLDGFSNYEHAGWEKRCVIESSKVRKSLSGNPGLAAYAYIAKSSSTIAETCMLALNGEGQVIDVKAYEKVDISHSWQI